MCTRSVSAAPRRLRVKNVKHSEQKKKINIQIVGRRDLSPIRIVKT